KPADGLQAAQLAGRGVLVLGGEELQRRATAVVGLGVPDLGEAAVAEQAAQAIARERLQARPERHGVAQGSDLFLKRWGHALRATGTRLAVGLYVPPGAKSKGGPARLPSPHDRPEYDRAARRPRDITARGTLTV